MRWSDPLPTSVPLPATLTLFTFCSFGFGGIKRRRARRQEHKRLSDAWHPVGHSSSKVAARNNCPSGQTANPCEVSRCRYQRNHKRRGFSHSCQARAVSRSLPECNFYRSWTKRHRVERVNFRMAHDLPPDRSSLYRTCIWK